jgi:hypothetical protein
MLGSSQLPERVPQFSLRFSAFSDISDITLDDWPAVFVVTIADKFQFGGLAGLRISPRMFEPY